MAGCRRTGIRLPTTPTPWCWCRRTTSSAPNWCSTTSCCRRRGATRPTPTNTNFDTYCSQDLEQALNSIFYNQNVGPFICRQLIQRLVTSNPSRDYLYRVAQVFNDDGTGVRGNLQAVVKAILLDYEARSPDMIAAANLRQTARTAPARHRAGPRLSRRRRSERHLQPKRQPDHHHHHHQRRTGSTTATRCR